MSWKTLYVWATHKTTFVQRQWKDLKDTLPEALPVYEPDEDDE
jgi:hypothetical protein